MRKALPNRQRHAPAPRGGEDRHRRRSTAADELGVGQEIGSATSPESLPAGGDAAAAREPLSRHHPRSCPEPDRGAAVHAARGFRNGEVAERSHGRETQGSRRTLQVIRTSESQDQPAPCSRFGCADPPSRCYRATGAGQRFMSTAIHVCAKLFAEEFGPQAYYCYLVQRDSARSPLHWRYRCARVTFRADDRFRKPYHGTTPRASASTLIEPEGFPGSRTF